MVDLEALKAQILKLAILNYVFTFWAMRPSWSTLFCGARNQNFKIAPNVFKNEGRHYAKFEVSKVKKQKN